MLPSPQLLPTTAGTWATTPLPACDLHTTKNSSPDACCCFWAMKREALERAHFTLQLLGAAKAAEQESLTAEKIHTTERVCEGRGAESYLQLCKEFWAPDERRAHERPLENREDTCSHVGLSVVEDVGLCER